MIHSQHAASRRFNRKADRLTHWFKAMNAVGRRGSGNGTKWRPY